MRKETYLLDMKIDQILTVVGVLSKYITVTRLAPESVTVPAILAHSVLTILANSKQSEHSDY